MSGTFCEHRTVKLAALAVLVFAGLAPAARSQAGGHPAVPVAVTHGPTVTGITDRDRALDRLHTLGYRWQTEQGADKAIRHWQKVNGLEVDGIPGPITLASLGLPGAVVPGMKVAAPAAGSGDPPSPPVAAADPCTEMSAYRQAAGLPEAFDAIGYRESRCRNDVTSSTGCCVGYWQNFLSSHLSRQSAYRDRIINECGVTHVSDIRGSSDAQKRASACVTFVVWSISGTSPWAL